MAFLSFHFQNYKLINKVNQIRMQIFLFKKFDKSKLHFFLNLMVCSNHRIQLIIVVFLCQNINTMNYLRFGWSVLNEAAVYARRSLGQMIRESGLELDRRGSLLQKDIAYLEPINRHRNVLNLEEYQHSISNSVHIAPSATVYGNVSIARDSYIGFGAVVDGLYNPIRVGFNTKIGDNTTVQSSFWVPDDAFPLSTTIGNNVNIQHSCNVVNALIDDDVHIGFRTVVMQGVQIERGVVVAPNSYVPAGSRLPQNTLWAGNPIHFVKNLQPYANRVEKQGAEQIKVSLPEQSTTTA